MKIEVITLFPEMFTALNSSITGRAQTAHKIHLKINYLRDYTLDKHKTVDDVPFGGEPGMVLKPEPLKAAIEDVQNRQKAHTIFMSPQGRPLTQARAGELSKMGNILIICGHYKGIDQRIRDKYVDEELSIGDYVLTGGELPAMVVIDSLTRLIPGVLGDTESLATDSFYDKNPLGWPVYTRPSDFEGEKVPDVLLSGNHKKIAEWRNQARLDKTRDCRPDLIAQ